MTASPVTITEACARAGRVLALARIERDELAARGGPEAVAQAACPTGTDEDRAAIAKHYEQLQRQARGHQPAA